MDMSIDASDCNISENLVNMPETEPMEMQSISTGHNY